MKCEACGGDGLIEYGAYRGDANSETRECRLCGGPTAHDECDTGAISFKDEKGVKRIQRTLAATGFSRSMAQKVDYPTGAGGTFQLTGNRLRLISSESGSREVVTELKTEPAPPEWPDDDHGPIASRSWNPADVAREYAQRLHAENERRQREAEVKRHEHRHDWQAKTLSEWRVEFSCACGVPRVVLSAAGSLLEGAPPPELLDLSRRAQSILR